MRRVAWTSNLGAKYLRGIGQLGWSPSKMLSNGKKVGSNKFESGQKGEEKEGNLVVSGPWRNRVARPRGVRKSDPGQHKRRNNFRDCPLRTNSCPFRTSYLLLPISILCPKSDTAWILQEERIVPVGRSVSRSMQHAVTADSRRSNVTECDQVSFKSINLTRLLYLIEPIVCGTCSKKLALRDNCNYSASTVSHIPGRVPSLHGQNGE